MFDVILSLFTEGFMEKAKPTENAYKGNEVNSTAKYAQTRYRTPGKV